MYFLRVSTIPERTLHYLRRDVYRVTAEINIFRFHKKKIRQRSVSISKPLVFYIMCYIILCEKYTIYGNIVKTCIFWYYCEHYINDFNSKILLLCYNIIYICIVVSCNSCIDEESIERHNIIILCDVNSMYNCCMSSVT
jgi:hypothetical protein